MFDMYFSYVCISEFVECLFVLVVEMDVEFIW